MDWGCGEREVQANTPSLPQLWILSLPYLPWVTVGEVCVCDWWQQMGHLFCCLLFMVVNVRANAVRTLGRAFANILYWPRHTGRLSEVQGHSLRIGKGPRLLRSCAAQRPREGVPGTWHSLFHVSPIVTWEAAVLLPLYRDDRQGSVLWGDVAGRC